MKNHALNRILMLIMIPLVLGIAAAFFTGFMKAIPAYASGSVQVSVPETHPVQIIAASTDDPLFHKDPGMNVDVAQCRLRLEQGRRVRLVILKGYPGYACTFSLTIHNRGDQAVRLVDTQISAASGLEVTRVNAVDDGLIPAGEKIRQVFKVYILPHASEMAQLSFQISEIFRLEETGLSVR